MCICWCTRAPSVLADLWRLGGGSGSNFRLRGFETAAGPSLNRAHLLRCRPVDLPGRSNRPVFVPWFSAVCGAVQGLLCAAISDDQARRISDDWARSRAQAPATRSGLPRAGCGPCFRRFARLKAATRRRWGRFFLPALRLFSLENFCCSRRNASRRPHRFSPSNS